MKKIYRMTIALLCAATVTGCSGINNNPQPPVIDIDQDDIVTPDVSEQTPDIEPAANNENIIIEGEPDFDKLGITPYSYPEQFEMTPNLESALTVMISGEDNWDSDVSVCDELWRDTTFKSRFIQNSRLTFDYLNEITGGNDDAVSKEELEYIHYSLTGKIIDFRMKDGEEVHTNPSSSEFNYHYLKSYTYDADWNNVQMQVVVTRQHLEPDGDDFKNVETDLKATVFLEKNPYSCFDGYTIKRIIRYSDDDIYAGYAAIVSNPKAFEWRDFNVMADGYNWDGFQLIDFNGDGIEELIATNRDENRFDGGIQYYMIVSQNENGLVVNYVFDGVASAGGYRGSKSYIAGKGIYDDAIYAPYGTPNFSFRVFEKGKLVVKESGYLDVNRDYEYPECMEKGTWYWNDKAVTEAEYNEKVKELTQNDSGKTLESIDYIDKDTMLRTLEGKMQK